MGAATSCDRPRKPNGEPDFSPSPATGYGGYYVTGFSLGKNKTNPAVLWLVWRKVNQDWKAVSYVVMTP
jgi:hypothetical protein